MKYLTRNQAENEARFINDLAKSKWFCPFRNDTCYGVGCIAFSAVSVKETFGGKFKLDADIPQCNLSGLEEMPKENTFANRAMLMAAATTTSERH
jgi:hypothetical protein